MTVICTHDGPFHADDVLAAAVARWAYPRSEIVRTRDPGSLRTAEMVVDVGGVYDPDSCRYDHHQRGGAGARENGVPYAAAGLVWKHFGRQLLAEQAMTHGVELEPLWARVDEMLFWGVDAADNGELDSRSTLKARPGTNISVLSFSGTISLLNPVIGLQAATPEAYQRGFENAVVLASQLLQQTILRAIAALKAEKSVAQADRGGSVLLLEEPSPDVGCPWTSAVCARPHILFVVFPMPNGEGWRVKCAQVTPGSFNVRKSLPSSWGGLSGEELERVTGVQGCVFCHRGCWIAGAKTREAAKALAQLALRS